MVVDTFAVFRTNWRNFFFSSLKKRKPFFSCLSRPGNYRRCWGGRGVLLHIQHGHWQLTKTKKNLLLYIVFLIYFKLICIIFIFILITKFCICSFLFSAPGLQEGEWERSLSCPVQSVGVSLSWVPTSLCSCHFLYRLTQPSSVAAADQPLPNPPIRPWPPASPGRVCAWELSPAPWCCKSAAQPWWPSASAGAGSWAACPPAVGPPGAGCSRSPAGPRGGRPEASGPPPCPLCAWSLDGSTERRCDDWWGFQICEGKKKGELVRNVVCTLKHI